MLIYSCEVQLGQRVALIGICVKQCGHSLVVTSAGAGGAFRRLAALTTRKMANAMIMKSMIVVMNTP